MKSLGQKFIKKWPLGLMFFTALLLFGVYFLSQGQAASGNPAGEPIPGDQKMIQDMEQSLGSSKLSAEDRANLEKKLQLNEQLAAQRSGNTASRGPKTGVGIPVPLPTASGQQAVPFTAKSDEIVEGSEGLIHAWEAQIQNLWQGERSGTTYQVLAGALPDDPSQGLVIVIAGQAGALKRSQNTYLAPQKSGALRIIRLQDNTVILLDASGGALSFDLATQTFLK